MVRLGIYDYFSNNSSENKDRKHSFAFDSYTNTSVISPYTVVDINDDVKPGDIEDVTIKPSSPGSREGEGEDRSKAEKDPEDVSQVWWNFLSETSLHGCKNVKERQFVKRVVWCCFILLMAGTLSWALTNLLLKYNEHPFVSVWGFQRENTITAPGLTICIPAKFNEEKLETARPAYRMLAYGETSTAPLSEGGASMLEGYQKYFNIWRKELENVTVSQARQEIGFTKTEVFWYSSLYLKDRTYLLTDIMHDIDMEAETCWTLHWFDLDTSEKAGFVFEDSSEEDDEAIYNESGDSSTLDDILSVHDSASEPRTEIAYNGTKNSSSTNSDNLKKASTLSKPTFEWVVTTLFASVPSTPSNTLESSAASTTAAPTSRPSQVTSRAGGDDDKEEKLGESNPVTSDSEKVEGSGMLRLSSRDSITFVMNMQQYYWLSTNYYAGVKLYLHDMSEAFWTVNPLLLRPGTMSSVYYKTTKYKFLPPPYKSFGGIGAKEQRSLTRNTGCVDTTSTSFQHNMVSRPPALYSSDLCMLEVSMNRSTQECGCSVDPFYNKLHGTKECSIYKYQQCFAKRVDQELYKQQTLLGEGKESPCPQACKMTRYESTVTSANYPTTKSYKHLTAVTGLSEGDIDENILMFTIKPQGPLTVTVEHVPELTMLNILGSVGGWMGLCLGASFLTLTELFEAFVMSAWILSRKLVRRMRA